MNDTVVETDAARPVWELLQAIDWTLYDPDMCKPSLGNASLCRTPNATEVRSMTWQAIANGANGIFYWEFNDLFRNPDVGFNESFGYYCLTAQEVLRFAPILLSDWGKGTPPSVTPPTAKGWYLPPSLPPSLSPSLPPFPPSLCVCRLLSLSVIRSLSIRLHTRLQWTNAQHSSFVLFAVSDGRGGGAVTFDIGSLFSSQQLHGALAFAVERVMEADPQRAAAAPRVSGSAFSCKILSILFASQLQPFDKENYQPTECYAFREIRSNYLPDQGQF